MTPLFRSLSRRFALSFVLLACVFTSAAHAQTAKPPARTLRVATRTVPPFVMRQGADYSGFSIELWREIAARIGVKTQFQSEKTVSKLLNSVKSGRADAGIAAISITADRDRQFDFSQPIYNGGLQIMVPDAANNSGGLASLRGFAAQFFSPTLRVLIGLMLLTTLVFAHLIWLVERRHDDGLVESPRYIPGIFKALWWSSGTLGAQADEMPRSGWGRLVAVLWMFISIVFIAFFTATVTTTLTVQQLHGDIQGPNDLPGKRVATVAGSTSAQYLGEMRLNPQEFASVDGAYDALTSGRAEAVVYDAPILLFHAARQGRGRVQVVGPVFRKEDYGIAFPNGSAWRKPINNALLQLKEDGTYDRLATKYFGENAGSES